MLKGLTAFRWRYLTLHPSDEGRNAQGLNPCTVSCIYRIKGWFTGFFFFFWKIKQNFGQKFRYLDGFFEMVFADVVAEHTSDVENIRIPFYADFAFVNGVEQEKQQNFPHFPTRSPTTKRDLKLERPDSSELTDSCENFQSTQ